MSTSKSSRSGVGHTKLEELLACSNDLIFVGSRETGKTTLAHQICLLTSEGKADKPRIPAIIDMRRTSHVNDMKKGIFAYLSHEDYASTSDVLIRDLRQSFDECDFLVCLDNFDLSKNHHLSAIRKMIDLKYKARFILFCDEFSTIVTGISRVKQSLQNADIVNIQPLSRKMIRELSSRKLASRKVSDPEVADYIVKQFRNNDLPRTGYIVTLLLWAWEKNYEQNA